MPSARRKGYSALLVDDALKAANGKGVFATSRTTNTAMWKTLERYSFKKTGNVYLARNRKDKIQLFLRPAHNIEEDLLRRK
jgi:hypothetical protein